MTPVVPYAELFTLFGVTPRFDAVAVHKVLVDPTKGTEQAIAELDLTEYADHPITRPISGLPMVFLGACPLMLAKPLPQGVTAQSILDLPSGADYWADTNLFAAMQGQAKRDEAEDLFGPLPLAVASTRQVGGAEQKAVLFGGTFAEDRITQAAIQGRPAFPGSEELFVNSALWISGEDQMIQVSPQVLQARRLGDLGRQAGWMRLVLVFLLPAIVLALGITVYYIRRR